MHVEDRHGVDELRGLARKARDARLRTRLQALVLAKQGHTAVHTAELLGMSRRVVQKCVQRYDELPPYSPELNPMENLWHYLRSHYWSNRTYEDYEALLDAATGAWQEASLDPALVRTVSATPYLKECT